MICLSNISLLLLPAAAVLPAAKVNYKFCSFSAAFFRLPWHLDLCAWRLKIQFHFHFFVLPVVYPMNF